MDNKGKIILVGFISFVVGAAAGGTGMYFYSKKYFQDKADAEIQEMCNYYISKYEEGGGKDEEKDQIESTEETEKEAKVQAKYEAISDIYKSSENESERVNTSYSKCYDGSSSGSDDSAPKKKKTSRKKKVDIEIVNQEVWDENPGSFDSKFLVYYDPDNVLIDEESEKPFEENNDIVNIVNLHSDDAVGGVLILQDNVNKFLYHVTVEQMSYMEQLTEDDD